MGIQAQSIIPQRDTYGEQMKTEWLKMKEADSFHCNPLNIIKPALKPSHLPLPTQ